MANNEEAGIDKDKSTQVNAKITVGEKLALIALAKAKGAEGITGLLKMLAVAKEVEIRL
jgi:hypothetical protein